MRNDSDENFNGLNQFLKESRIGTVKNNSREMHSNNFLENESKAKSVPAEDRKIDEDHITFGKDGCDLIANDIEGFEEVLLKDQYKNQYENDEKQIRNKSVVIPRSSILLKNKKNMQKRNQDIQNSKSLKNYSVSPSKIVFAPKRAQRGRDSNPEYDTDEKIGNMKNIPFRNLNRAKINFKNGSVFQANDSSNQIINDSIKKNKIKFVRNKIAPFKFIKNKKKGEESEDEGSIKSNSP